MIDPVPARKIAELIGGCVMGGRAEMMVEGVASLNHPEAGRVIFVKTLTPELNARLGAVPGILVLIPEDAETEPNYAHIRCRVPRSAFARVVNEFFTNKRLPGISPRASVHPTANIAPNVTIGDFATIGPHAIIGEGTEIRSGVVIGPRVKIGRNCLIKSNSVVGQEGFGIDKDEAQNNLRLPHLGSVAIGDYVEIGALNTVCSGTLDPTIVGDYVKTDDHVHIAHNVQIGRNCILTACAEISGSVCIGERTWLGPNCSIINNIEIGVDVFIGIGSVVTKSLPDRVVAAGCPARIIRQNSVT